MLRNHGGGSGFTPTPRSGAGIRTPIVALTGQRPAVERHQKVSGYLTAPPSGLPDVEPSVAEAGFEPAASGL